MKICNKIFSSNFLNLKIYLILLFLSNYVNLQNLDLINNTTNLINNQTLLNNTDNLDTRNVSISDFPIEKNISIFNDITPVNLNLKIFISKLFLFPQPEEADHQIVL